ncbi:uracil-DNA glycosylase [Verrucomicrobium sp. BvORR106]|uniref:uracil-DNA glycosylase n=1 Tax=Verrucomicrobium sp. BvORR106 TaxID=1403819 RepID=UPI00068BFE5C|nr:uracil-DNA glycosylase [Verrucomicrobium sp. BvORR106]
MSTAIDLLKLHLAQQAARGVTHVALTRGAQAQLRGGRSAPAVRPQAPATPPAVPTPAPPTPVRRTEYFAQPAAPTPAQPPVSRPMPERISLSSPSPLAPAPQSRAEHLARLALEAENSEKARSLGTLRDIMVFATGTPDAEIVFVGEAPGAEEEKLREPFVGPAGQLLTKIIQAMGLRRNEVYITNICKFRPKIDDGRFQNSKNRAPTIGEMLSCQQFVLAELEIIKPKVIVALGSTAATGLGIEGTVGKLRGKFHDFRGTPIMVTYHPSYLLRREQEDGGGIAEKRLVWEDMMKVMEQVGLPISDKQRAYFSKARG